MILDSNNNNISTLDTPFGSTQMMSINWLQHTNVTNSFELSNQYATIFQQHKQDKKWVLFINPEENSIEKLAKTHGIDVSKILLVNYKNTSINRVKVALKQITSVLSKGNCSAVILSDNEFKTDEIEQLEFSAKLGKTYCFLMKQSQLH